MVSRAKRGPRHRSGSRRAGQQRFLGPGVSDGASARGARWPKSERVSREDLIAITNSYFDSLSARDGHIMIAHPGCVRLENGVLTTQRDAPANPPANAAGIFNGKTDCMNGGP